MSSHLLWPLSCALRRCVSRYGVDLCQATCQQGISLLVHQCSSPCPGLLRLYRQGLQGFLGSHKQMILHDLRQIWASEHLTLTQTSLINALSTGLLRNIWSNHTYVLWPSDTKSSNYNSWRSPGFLLNHTVGATWVVVDKTDGNWLKIH